MTYGDLKRHILNLGFETSEGYEEEASILPDACNLAMRDITALFPLVGRYTLCQRPLRTLLDGGRGGAGHYDGVSPLLFAADDARALYFECSGSGLLTITDDDGGRELPLSSAQNGLQAYRAFVRGAVRLSFAGPFSYDVQNLALYGEVLSEQEADIPAFRRYARYDLQLLTREAGDGKEAAREVFCGFLDKVQEGDETQEPLYRSLQNFQIEAPATIVLDGFARAQYTFFYKRAFVPFSVTTKDETPLELPFAQQHLLPLLAAYYVWLDDDLTKASLYYNKYEESRDLLLANDKETLASVESWGDF